MLKLFSLCFNPNVLNQNTQILKLLTFFIDDSEAPVQLQALTTMNTVLEYFQKLGVNYVITET
jgi:hypothetical protein